MKLTPELHALLLVTIATVLMWVPYTIARTLKYGLWAAMANPDPVNRPDAPWAERAKRAHANAVENLVVFAPVVLVAALLNVSTSATVLAAQTYLVARLVHYLVYAAGIPIARTLAFVVGVVATIVIAMAALAQAAA